MSWGPLRTGGSVGGEVLGDPAETVASVNWPKEMCKNKIKQMDERGCICFYKIK